MTRILLRYEYKSRFRSATSFLDLKTEGEIIVLATEFYLSPFHSIVLQHCKIPTLRVLSPDHAAHLLHPVRDPQRDKQYSISIDNATITKPCQLGLFVGDTFTIEAVGKSITTTTFTVKEIET